MTTTSTPALRRFAQRRHATVPTEETLALVRAKLAALDDRLVLSVFLPPSLDRVCEAVTHVAGPWEAYGDNRGGRIRREVGRLLDRLFPEARKRGAVR